MAILRSEIKNQYSQIPNAVIRDKQLSHSEYRLLIYLYSLPDSWKIDQGFLGKELGCTRININQKLAKIKQCGYLEIQRADKDSKKDVDFIYILKIPSVSKTDVSKTDTYINTNIINNDINNTDIINTPKPPKGASVDFKKEVIDYLNLKAGTRYKYNIKKTNEYIDARYNEGFTLADFKKVIDIKTEQWYGTSMSQYLRPTTLFGTKFESYLNDKNIKIPMQINNKPFLSELSKFALREELRNDKRSSEGLYLPTRDVF